MVSDENAHITRAPRLPSNERARDLMSHNMRIPLSYYNYCTFYDEYCSKTFNLISMSQSQCTTHSLTLTHSFTSQRCTMDILRPLVQTTKLMAVPHTHTRSHLTPKVLIGLKILYVPRSYVEGIKPDNI